MTYVIFSRVTFLIIAFINCTCLIREIIIVNEIKFANWFETELVLSLFVLDLIVTFVGLLAVIVDFADIEDTQTVDYLYLISKLLIAYHVTQKSSSLHLTMVDIACGLTFGVYLVCKRGDEHRRNRQKDYFDTENNNLDRKSTELVKY